VEHQESLQPRTVVGKLADPIQAQVHNLLANCSRQNMIICKWNYVNNGGVLSGTQGPRRQQRSNWKLTMDFDSQNFDLILQQAASMISNRCVHKACKDFKMLIKQLDVNYIPQGVLVQLPVCSVGKLSVIPVRNLS
jgi:hypothetical protein